MSLQTYIIKGERIAARSYRQALYSYREIQKMLNSKITHRTPTKVQQELDL